MSKLSSIQIKHIIEEEASRFKFIMENVFHRQVLIEKVPPLSMFLKAK
jgi:hypothetical protein